MPWLRLVCRRWAGHIKERRCDICTIVKWSEQITISLWEEFKNYVPLRSENYIKFLCYKPISPNKLEQLYFAVYLGLPIPKYIDLGLINDVQTLNWLVEHNFSIRNQIEHLNKYNKKLILHSYNEDVIKWYNQQGMSIALNFRNKLSEEQIHQSLIPIHAKNYFYIKTGNLDLIKKLDLSDNCPQKLMSAAILSLSLDIIDYIYHKTEVKINTLHYAMTNLSQIHDRLFSFSRQSKLRPSMLKNMNRLSFLTQCLDKKYYIPTNRDFIWATAYQYLDVLNWLEWYNCQPHPQIFDDITHYCQRKNILFKHPTATLILKWYASKNILPTPKFIFYISSHTSPDVIHWLLFHKIPLPNSIYLTAIKNAEYSLFDTLFEHGLTITQSTKIKHLLKSRGSSKLIDWFKNHFNLYLN